MALLADSDRVKYVDKQFDDFVNPCWSFGNLTEHVLIHFSILQEITFSKMLYNEHTRAISHIYNLASILLYIRVLLIPSSTLLEYAQRIVYSSI